MTAGMERVTLSVEQAGLWNECGRGIERKMRKGENHQMRITSGHWQLPTLVL